jgi:hypothetical protein
VTGAFTINTVTGFGTTEFDLGIHLKQVATQFIYPGSQTGSGFQALSYLASSGSTGSSGLYTNNGFTINAVGLTVSAGGAAITGAVSMSSTVSTPALGSNTGTTLVLDASNFVKANSSSERFKSNVRRGWDHRNGQSSLLSVSPILFDYDDGVSNVLGFSAEEVHAAGLTDLVNLDAEGKPFSLREHGFLAHLTSIARDHEARLTALERK